MSNFFQITIILVCIGIISFFGFHIIKDIRFILNHEMAANRQIIKQQSDKRVPDTSELYGGYALKNELIIGNYKILGLLIDSGKYSRSIAFFLVQNINDSHKDTCNCLLDSLNSGKISVRTAEETFGQISFQGIFLPVKDGNYWLVSENVTVLKGKLQVMRNNKVIYSNENQEFAFHMNNSK